MSVPTATAAALPRPVLADLLPGTRTAAWLRDAALVIGGTVFIAIFAQLTLPLPFTPVPLTLGTAAVLLSGVALGPQRAALSTLLYLAAGMAGAPIFSEQSHGYAFASFGYILAYVPAAVLIGYLARRGHDRSPIRLFGAVALSSVVIYTAGLGWLMAWTGADLQTALVQGMLPFLPGDAIKALVVAGLLPATWRLINNRR